MKKLCLFLILLSVISVQSRAADFLDSLRQYHVQILRHLNVDTATTSYQSTAQTYAFLREAIVAVVPQIRSNKAIRDTTIAYMNDQIVLDSDVVGIIAVRWKKNDSAKSLLPVPKEKWFQLSHQSTAGQKGYLFRPSYYSYIEGFLSLYPVPTNSIRDTIQITVWVKAPNIAIGTAFTSIPTQYRVVILDYAVWKSAQSKNHPLWKDFRDNYMAAARELNATLGDPQITGTGVAGGGGKDAGVSTLPSSPAN